MSLEPTYRESQSPYTIGYSWKYERLSGALGGSDTITYKYYLDKLSGFKNSRWRSQIARGQNATTPMTGFAFRTIEGGANRQSLEYVHPPGSQSSWFWKLESVAYWPPFIPTSTQLSSLSGSTAENEAASLFHIKANQAMTDLYTGVILGELKETIQLITGTGKRLVESLVNYREQAEKLVRSRRGGEDLRDALADLWLSFSFGWSPLLNDIDSAIDYLVEAGKTRKKIRAISTEQNLISSSRYNIGPSQCGFSGLRRIHTEVTVMYVGSVSVHGIWADAGRLGLHPKDWLPTIYELLPWSFVIDYFVNLNAIIAALSNAFISVDWVSKTTRKSYVTRVTNITPRRLSPGVYPNSELIVREFSPRNSKHVVKRVDREALDGVSIPNLVFSLPDSFGQVINLLSLYVAREETRDLVKSL